VSKFKGRKKKSRTAFGGKSRQAQEFIGRVQKNRRGFAFLIVENAKIPDVYVDQGQSSVLLNGDRVAFTIQKDGRRSSGRILKIIERTQKFVLGKIQPGKREYLMTAEGETFDLIGKVKKSNLDQWVVAKIEGEPSLRLPPLVSLTEELGTELKPCHDVRITTARFGLPEEFPKSLEAELKSVKLQAEEEFTSPERKDLTHLPFVTIDGADAKDLD
jgi:ribonuclease R